MGVFGGLSGQCKKWGHVHGIVPEAHWKYSELYSSRNHHKYRQLKENDNFSSTKSAKVIQML